MAQENQGSSMWDIIKNIFLLLIFLQIAPVLVLNIKNQYTKFFTPQTQVGVIPIKGFLYDSSSYTKNLNTFFKDPSIKAILLRIECPGGASGTSQALFNEIQMLKKQYHKPIITLVENVCASGGYYVASSTDYIIASGAATIGSIGAYFPGFQLKEFIDQFKIQYIPIKAGAYKAATDPFEVRTPAQTELLQVMTDDIYAQFTQDIATQRKLSLQTIDTWANGKIFTAKQALELQLIDELGSAQNAIAKIKDKALIDGEIEWVHPSQESTWASLFGSSSEGDSDSMFNLMMHKICSFLHVKYGSTIF
jgi:protease-4